MKEKLEYLFSIKGMVIFVFAFFLGVLATAAGLSFTNIFLLFRSNVETTSDAISIANTYIVLVTLLFVMMTVFITMYTIWFSRWFSRERSKEIRDNIHIIAYEMEKNAEVRNLFITILFRNDELNEEIKDQIIKILNEEMTDTIKNSLDINFALPKGGDNGDKNKD